MSSRLDSASDLPFSLSSSYVGHWSLGRTVFCTEHWTARWIRKALSSSRCCTQEIRLTTDTVHNEPPGGHIIS